MNRRAATMPTPSWYATLIGQVRAEEAVRYLGDALAAAPNPAEHRHDFARAIRASWTAAAFVLMARRDVRELPDKGEVQQRVAELSTKPRPLPPAQYDLRAAELSWQSKALEDGIQSFEAEAFTGRREELVKLLADTWTRAIACCEGCVHEAGIAGWRRILIMGGAVRMANVTAAAGERATERRTEILVDLDLVPKGQTAMGNLTELTTEGIVCALRQILGDAAGRAPYPGMLLVEVAAQAGAQPLLDLPRLTAAYCVGRALPAEVEWGRSDITAWSKGFLTEATESACRGQFEISALVQYWARQNAEWTTSMIAHRDRFVSTEPKRETVWGADTTHLASWFTTFVWRYGKSLFRSYVLAVMKAAITAGVIPEPP